jgi:hypothetical protein
MSISELCRGNIAVANPPEDDRFAPEVHYVFYVPAVSTRGVLVAYDGEEYELTVNSCCCSEDYELLLQLLESLAAAGATHVSSDFHENLPLTDLRQAYTNEWIEKDIAFNVKALFDVSTASIVSMLGTIRQFNIGPRLSAELQAQGNARTDKLMTAIRQTQYPDEQYFCGPVYVLKPRGKQYRMSSITAEVDHFLPWVQYVGLLAETEEQNELRLIRYNEFLGLLPEKKWRYADEKSIYLSRLRKKEYLKIYENKACQPVDTLA